MTFLGNVFGRGEQRSVPERVELPVVMVGNKGQGGVPAAVQALGQPISDGEMGNRITFGGLALRAIETLAMDGMRADARTAELVRAVDASMAYGFWVVADTIPDLVFLRDKVGPSIFTAWATHVFDKDWERYKVTVVQVGIARGLGIGFSDFGELNAPKSTRVVGGFYPTTLECPSGKPMCDDMTNWSRAIIGEADSLLVKTTGHGMGKQTVETLFGGRPWEPKDRSNAFAAVVESVAAKGLLGDHSHVM